MSTSILPARPTGREEAWRFTPVSELGRLYDAELTDAAFLVTVEASDGIDAAPDRVVVAADTHPSEPIVVTVTGRDGRAGAHALTLDVGAHSTATVLLHFGGHAAVATDLDVTIGQGAQLNLVTVHDWAIDGLHLDAQRITLGRDARLAQTTVSIGGGLVRHDVRVGFTGPGGDAHIGGLIAAGAPQQHLEHRLRVEHSAPHCRSRVISKAVLAAEHAHTVWVGDVFIGARAIGTDTYETNRNLVLVDAARADSVPNLEIETGEVAGAGHASATGRFDDEQLFYLCSRGIDEATARRLVVRGFLAEVLDPLAVVPGLAPLHHDLTERLAAITLSTPTLSTPTLSTPTLSTPTLTPTEASA